MTTILLIAYGDDFGTSTEIVKLDFGEPGVNVQEGFLKLGLPDGGTGTFSSSFEYSGQELTIRITGFTHTRGNYKAVMNFYAGLSNLLRSSFLRNSRGVINVEIFGLIPLSVYSIKTYHHSTSYARGGVSFSLQYEGNLKIKLKQSGYGKNPDPPLTHTEMVQSSRDGVVRLVMESENVIGGVQNAHMDLNGMEIKYIGSTDNLKLDFGEPGVNVQEGFLKLGRPDGPGGVRYYSKFDWSGQTVAITITGYTYIRGNLKPVTNAYARLSNLLRSSFLRSSPGEMIVKISGLKRWAMYLIKTYHHSTSYSRGGRSFSLQYKGNDKILLKQSGNGQSPDPPLVHSEVVQSSGDGIVRLVMNSNHGGGGKQQSDAHMDLNGMEIWYIGMRSTDTVKFDFGEPGVNVQEGFLKVGPATGRAGTFVSAFEHFGQSASIEISGFTFSREWTAKSEDEGPFSSLLRSSFYLNIPGEMRVDIIGLKPLAVYRVKTFHHDIRAPASGELSVTLCYYWEGLPKRCGKQTGGDNPDNFLAPVFVVRSNRFGFIRFVMDSRQGGGSAPKDAPMNINGMTLKLQRDIVKLNFGCEPGVNVQEGFVNVGSSYRDDLGNTSYVFSIGFLGETMKIKFTGWTQMRGNFTAVTNKYAGLSNLLRSSFLRESPGVMNVEISGVPAGRTYLIRTYHHSTSYPRNGKFFFLQYEGGIKYLVKQHPYGGSPDPPLVFTEVVQSSSEGIIRLVMETEEGRSEDVPDNAQMNLNGMEIILAATGLDSGKLDFGTPGVNMQDGYQKIGLPDHTNNNNYIISQTFRYFGRVGRIKIAGYERVRGDNEAVINTWSYLSNLLRSSVLRFKEGSMKVEISGLEPLTMYVLKTYHHQSWQDASGAEFVMKYEGNDAMPPKQQSKSGQKPNPPSTITATVLSSADGIIKMEMIKGPQTPDLCMNLNGMEIYLWNDA